MSKRDGVDALKELFRELRATNYVEVGDIMKAIASHIETKEKALAKEEHRG